MAIVAEFHGWTRARRGEAVSELASAFVDAILIGVLFGLLPRRA